MGVLMLPIILLLVTGILILSILGSAFGSLANGGRIEYDEVVFQRYADQEYAKAFSGSDAYEDNLLLVFLTSEDADYYYAIAWVGDNIHTKINTMFGDETSTFGNVVRGSINGEYYAYSLDSNLATVMDTMTDKVTALKLESSFKTQQPHNKRTTSHLVNYTQLSLTASTVDQSLQNFTEQTDISTVIVVDTMENVFGKSLSASDIMTLIILLVIAGVAIYLIVRALRKNKNDKNGNSSDPSGNRYNKDSNGSNYNRDYNSGGRYRH